jgi:hypothetical protein
MALKHYILDDRNENEHGPCDPDLLVDRIE